MNAGSAKRCGTTYLHVGAALCNPPCHDVTRTLRLDAARAYMRALGASVAAGEAIDELRHDHGALASGGTRLLDMCGDAAAVPA